MEDQAQETHRDYAKIPLIHKHIAVMPDVHWGKGSTIGSVIPTKGAIIPAAVGVDIGCGMMAVQTTLQADQLPDSLSSLRSEIEAAVPHGRTDNGQANDRGAWGKDAPAPGRWGGGCCSVPAAVLAGGPMWESWGCAGRASRHSA